MPIVRATVRLQFHHGFTFEDAIPLVAYFRQLGISHIYSSPILKARAGSLHGYNVVDPTQVNPELGGEDALQRLVAELRQHQMGLIVDIVSNHMAVGGDDNPWWLDVLKWGSKSHYAQFFDIQWDSPDPAMNGLLLLPFLRGLYGDVLEAGQITVHFNDETGEFYARHFEHCFPLTPASYCHILYNSQDPLLQQFARDFSALDSNGITRTENSDRETIQSLHRQLSEIAKQPEQQAEITALLALYNIDSSQAADTDTTRYRLHQLLELQHYRLASWRTAADDINWRRFFDVNELGGLRVEKQSVFEAVHAKIFELIEKGMIDGLRIDHIDGLANPRAYCRKLRRRLDHLTLLRPQGSTEDHLPIYAEKILLGDGEQLASDWLLDGTTGYEFMNQVSLLQHDPKGAFQLYDLWSRVSGRQGSFVDEAKEARRLVLSSNLAGDVEIVARGLLSIARQDIVTRDLTLGALRRALIELLVHFPVYRTYATACGISRDQIEYFNIALAGATSTIAEADWSLLEYLERWLGRETLHEIPSGEQRSLRQKVLARFQQLSSCTAAKAVEDTAGYRSAVLLSRNDVGFDPQHFSTTPVQFHLRNKMRARSFPQNLLATATHDHKRGEDTRARMAVISERSVWFSEKVKQWQLLGKPLVTHLEDGPAPSPGDVLILYQTLLGCWPLTLSANDKAGMELFLARLLTWQEKAIREAKLRSHWNAPNIDYETASVNFLTRLLTAEETTELRQDIASAALSIAPAGAINSLSQILLKMTSPGVPDLYQGADFWDFSLVDPDNRQAVDFTSRMEALSAKTMPEELLQKWQDGRIKQWLIKSTLTLREQYAALFTCGNYQALQVEGEKADHIVAFAREYHDNCLIVITPRLPAGLLADSDLPLIPATAWGDTVVILPPSLSSRIFHDPVFAAAKMLGDRIPVRDVLDEFPVHVSVSAAALAPAQSTFKPFTERENQDEYLRRTCA